MHSRVSSEPGPRPHPVVARLAALGVEPTEVQQRLRATSGRPEVVPAKTLLQGEDEAIRRPRYLLSGWACRFTQLADGRRQVYDLVLPGEGLGVCTRPRPFALTSVMALSRVELLDGSDLVKPGDGAADGALARGLDKAADIDERRLLDQVVRLGRMTALERLAHLFLDLHDRLAVIGAVERGRYEFPVTQELLADLLGLSTVHVNRTIQELRRQELIVLDRTRAQVVRRDALVRLLASGAPAAAERASA